MAFLDDSSRCITGFGVSENATSANMVLALRCAIRRYGTQAQILSDRGTQFTASREKKRSRTKLTDYQAELAERDIMQVLARAHHPQTNGKIERFFGSLESEIRNYESVADYMEYYNERCLHFSLDMATGETPRLAFKRRKADRKVKNDLKWMEKDSYGRK